MSKPFKPQGYAFHSKQAQELEEQGKWVKAAEAWKRAAGAARNQENWFMANSRRDYCLRRLAQANTQREAS